MNKPNEIRNDEYLKKYAFPPKTSLMKKFLELFFESKQVIKNLQVCNNLMGLNTQFLSVLHLNVSILSYLSHINRVPM